MANISELLGKITFEYNETNEATEIALGSEFHDQPIKIASILGFDGVLSGGEVSNYTDSSNVKKNIGYVSVIFTNSGAIALGLINVRVPQFESGSVFQFGSGAKYRVSTQAWLNLNLTLGTFTQIADVTLDPDATLELRVPVIYDGTIDGTVADIPEIQASQGVLGLSLKDVDITREVSQVKSVFAILSGTINVTPSSTFYGEKVMYTITINNSGSKVGIVTPLTVELPKECDITNNVVVKVNGVELIKDTDYNVTSDEDSSLDSLTISRELAVPAKKTTIDGTLNITVECTIIKIE